MDGAAAIWITCGIKAEKNVHGLAPVRAVAFGVEEPHIELHMIAVISCQRITEWRFVQKRLCWLSHYSLVVARNAFVNHLPREIAILF